MTSLRRTAAACSAVLLMGLIPAGVAGADCSGAGDFGAGSGCPPPGDGSGSGSGDNWPPTSVDWPPAQSADAGSAGGGDDSSTPIVLPDGRPAPTHPAPPKDASATSAPPTPIVPVGALATAPAPAAIVAAAAGN